MAFRQEHGVFIAFALLVGWMVYSDLKPAPTTRGGGRGGGDVEFEHHYAPDVSRALPDDSSRGAFERDIFSAPSDTQPLPLLDLIVPPLNPLDVLAPPTAWGPLPAHMGGILRRENQIELVDDLFDAESLPPEFSASLDDGSMGAGELASFEVYRGLYDWIATPNDIYGHIRNANRYTLSERPDEAIIFVEVNPKTGAERFTGQAAIETPRAIIEDFGFADTVANRIELGLVALGMRGKGPDNLGAPGMRSSQLEEALEFARQCVDWRHEALRALEAAENVYNAAEIIADGDPRPQLGLARCLEAGYRFEEAFDIYHTILKRVGDAQEAVVLHARLGDLLARFRLFDKARAEYNEALSRSRTHWEANLRYGRFLLERGEAEEALPYLEAAHRREPSGDLHKTDRANIRTTLGWAQVAVGKMDAAQSTFVRALSNDPSDQEAKAGEVSASIYGSGSAGADLESLLAEGFTGAGFDLSLALGLAAAESGDLRAARSHLELALSQDPFRSYLPLRTLSWVAERAGHPDRALTYIESAYGNNPEDAWTLYQRGRLYADSGDVDAAMDSFRAALDQELDFVEALVEMATLYQSQGDHESAERYYHRALGIQAKQPKVHTMRGYNFLAMDDSDAAEDSFKLALAKNPDIASAHNGVAWCRYLQGDAVEARTLYTELINDRRNEVEGDSHTVYAESQIVRILEHESKSVWRDRFERAPGTPSNGWIMDLEAGPDVALRDGKVDFEGEITNTGRTRLYREIQNKQFVNFEASLTVHAGTQGRCGIFLSLERRSSQGTKVQAEAVIARNHDGTMQARFIRTGETDAKYEELPAFDWPLDLPIPLSIETSGEGSDMEITLYVDGVPVMEPVNVPGLGRASAKVRFGAFVEGEAGRSVNVSFDDVKVVRRK